MNRWLTLIPIVALIALVAVSAFMLTREGERQTFSEGRIGRAAPSYALPRLDEGEAVSIGRTGRPYVINMFASWCLPCRAEHPVLMQLRESGVEIVGVAYKDEPAQTQAFLARLGDPFNAVGVDRDGRFGLELGILGVPETFVVSADGTIVAVHRGPLTPEVIEQTIRPALAGR